MSQTLKAVLATTAAIFTLALIGCSKKALPERESANENSAEVSVQPGWAFETTLQELSIPSELTASIVGSLDDIFDFRRCMPGDRAILVTTKTNEFKRFEYHRSPTRYFLVEPSDSGMAAREVILTTEKRVYCIEGSIQSSLYESIIVLGEGPELAYGFSDIFAWDIDFNVETRTNDRFSMLAVKEFANGEFVGYGSILYARYNGKLGNHEATRFENPDGHQDYYDENGKSLRKVFLRSALQYRRISSYFSKRRFHPILKIYCPHRGVDYAAPVGTPVSAIGDGVVTFAGWKGAYGKLIYLKHKAGYQSGYGHLSRFAKGIRKGKRVKQGQLIGYAGNTGRSTGPHLHFEMKRYGSHVNPLRVKIPAADPVPKKYASLFQKQKKNMASLVKAYELMGTTRELAEMSRKAVVKDSLAASGAD